MSLVAAQLVAKVVADTKPAEDGLKRVGEHADKTGGFLKGALKNALGFAAGAMAVGTVSDAFHTVTGAIGDMITAGMQANAVQSQTEAVLKSTHDASGMTAAGVDKLATKLMNLTGINDDTVASTENILLTFTSIHKDVFPAATKAALDMATAMKIGPQQAALLVGKALNDPIQGMTALRREGVQLSKTQQDQVKHFMAVGDKAKAQKIILGELNKEFGGSAKAAGKANGGLKILAAQFDNAKQQVGQALIPILTKLMDRLAPLVISFAQHLPDGIAKVTGAITTVSGKVGDFVSFLQNHQALFDVLKASLVGVGIAILASLVPAFVGWAVSAGAAAVATIVATAPILAIGVGIGLLILGIKLLISHGDQVKAFFGHIGEAVGAALGWLGRLKDFIVADVQNAFKSLGDGIGRVWGGIQSTIKGAINGVIGIINTYIRLLDAIQIHIPSVDAGPIHTPRFDWNGLNIPQIPKLALGGVIEAAGMALVGERGPERLFLPRGAEVAPLPSGGGGGGGGAPIHVHIHVAGRRVADAILPDMVATIRNRTGVRL